jgi:amino acid adenylation domain-containing protein
MKEPTIQSVNKTNFNPFSGPAIERVIYTTQPQAEIWVACKMGDKDANRAYNESVSLILRGKLEEKALLNAIQCLVDRHEALRSVFSTDGRFMTIFKHISVSVHKLNLIEFNEVEKNAKLNAYISADANYVFDLVKGPLFKVGFIKLSETEHQLILTAHHIICDGWSIGIMLEELGSLYSANVLNTEHNLPKPESFCTYADEQQTYLVSEAHKTNVNYWLNQFKDTVPQLTLPTDFPRPQSRTYKSERLDVLLDRNLTNALKKSGIKAGCSFVTTLLATFEIFVHAQSGQDDIILGLPSADQAASGKTQMIGHWVNLLPLRSKINLNSSFVDYLKQRKSELFDAYDHQKLSFGELLQKLSITRDPSRVPLVPVVFNIDMGMTDGVSFLDLRYELKSNPRNYETFELFLNATGSSDDLILEWSYNSNLFKLETIKNMMTSFEEIIKTVVTNPEIEIRDIIKVDYSAYSDLNDTQVPFPQLPLHELIMEQAKATPSQQAVKFGNSEITYQSLEKQVHQLAHCLREQGMSPGDCVAVSLPRSIELVVTLLAILECGGAYLPLDPNYPSKRLEFMIEDSSAKYLITTKSSSSSLKTNSKILVLETLFSGLKRQPNSPVKITVDNSELAYLLYTSGSTGKPKGVPITHRNLVNFLCSILKEPGINQSDRFLSVTTISFDIAGLELFAPLLRGALLVLANEETSKDSRLLLDVLKEEQITMMQATPTTWQMLLEAGWEQKLSMKALCGGEALPLGLAKKLLQRVDELWNMYGPTETTIWSAIKKISETDDLITIGHPIANTQIYIINEKGQLVEPGKTGELCIAGEGVAKGYLKREALTAEKFIKNPFDTDSKSTLYRTGDLAKLLPTGELQCFGRIDQQIKIRGHRIELGEIEQALDSLEGIQSSVVIMHHNRLVANVITNPLISVTDAIKTNWKKSLIKTLPGHMVPQQFRVLNEFPTTLNGKIDRRALEELCSNVNGDTDFSSASTNSEKIITKIWQDYLEIDKIDIHSDFFELGGHSLIAVKVMTQLEKQTGNRLPLAALLEHPTIKKLAAYMDNKFISWDSLVPLNPKGNKAPLFIVHGANHNVMLFKNLAKNLDPDQPVYALQAKGLSGEVEPHDSVEAMAAHYISEIKTINPEGPFALGGFSFGGIIAFEMVKQLSMEGKKVKVLALFDSYVYPHYYYSNPFKKRIVSEFYNLGQLIFMGLNMFSSIKNFKRRYKLLKIKIQGVYLKLKYGSEKQYQLQFQRSSKIDEMHEIAFLRYNLLPENVKVDLFRSTEEIYFAHDYKFLGWRKIALKGIRKHMITGNHSEMFLSPAVEEVSVILQNILDQNDLVNYD